jgi:hypothetical protein
MRRFVLAGAMLLALSVPSFATPCQDDVAKIEATIAKAEVQADVRAQAEDMHKQAKSLCAAGNETEGLAVTAEAKALLAIE